MIGSPLETQRIAVEIGHVSVVPLQLWPFITYNCLFLWDYTFLKWGGLVLITGKGT